VHRPRLNEPSQDDDRRFQQRATKELPQLFLYDRRQRLSRDEASASQALAKAKEMRQAQRPLYRNWRSSHLMLRKKCSANLLDGMRKAGLME
jgi:hypothetical protein